MYLPLNLFTYFSLKGICAFVQIVAAEMKWMFLYKNLLQF